MDEDYDYYNDLLYDSPQWAIDQVRQEVESRQNIIDQIMQLIKKESNKPLAVGEPRESIDLGRMQIVDEILLIMKRKP